MDMSFQEKSIAGSLVITILVFGWYFSELFKILMSDSSERLAGLPFVLVGVIIAVVFVEIVYHSAIALMSKPEDEDERDRLIEAKSARIAYFVLATGCILTIGHTLIGVYFEADIGDRLVLNPILTANYILMSFVLSEITGFGMQLYYYRRGI